MNQGSLCISLPVFNEEARLERGVLNLITFLNKNNINARIDIADNGSYDQTSTIADRLTKLFPSVSVTKVPSPGIGFALKTSWARATEEIVGYMDIDLSTDLNHLPQTLDYLYGARPCVVAASRLLPKSQVKGRSPKREIASRGFNFVLKRLLNVGFSDGMCGFKFMHRTVYETIHKQGLTSDSWFFATELLIRAEWLGIEVRDLPVAWTDAPSRNVSVLKLSRQYMREILTLRREKKQRWQ